MRGACSLLWPSLDSASAFHVPVGVNTTSLEHLLPKHIGHLCNLAYVREEQVKANLGLKVSNPSTLEDA